MQSNEQTNEMKQTNKIDQSKTNETKHNKTTKHRKGGANKAAQSGAILKPVLGYDGHVSREPQDLSHGEVGAQLVQGKERVLIGGLNKCWLFWGGCLCICVQAYPFLGLVCRETRKIY